MFEECHGLVFRTAYRITGNAADAEDVLQAVFLRLLRRDRSAEPLENPESYLRRAAINASLDVVRSRQETATVPLDESPPSQRPARSAGIAGRPPARARHLESKVGGNFRAAIF